MRQKTLQIFPVAKPEKQLKKVFRKATEEDFEQRQKNQEIEKQAHAFCVERIKELGLQMNLFSVETTFDASRLTFFFTADGRVDFRQLVKLLVKNFHVRVGMLAGGDSQPGQNVRRAWALRARVLLFQLHGKVRSGFDPHGQRPGALAQPHQNTPVSAVG